MEILPRAGVLAAGREGHMTRLLDSPQGRIQQVIYLFHACIIDTRDAFELISGHLDGAPPSGTYYEPPPDEDEEEG
jgi:hypothetical protein